MKGPSFLATAGDMDVEPRKYMPTFVDDGQRLLVFDGKLGMVSPENFEWMKTAAPAELGRMLVMRIKTEPPWLSLAPALADWQTRGGG